MCVCWSHYNTPRHTRNTHTKYTYPERSRKEDTAPPHWRFMSFILRAWASPVINKRVSSNMKMRHVTNTHRHTHLKRSKKAEPDVPHWTSDVTHVAHWNESCNMLMSHVTCINMSQVKTHTRTHIHSWHIWKSHVNESRHMYKHVSS